MTKKKIKYCINTPLPVNDMMAVELSGFVFLKISQQLSQYWENLLYKQRQITQS